MSINVANNNPHVVYTVAEGATQTAFSITFEFFDDDEVQLYVDGIIKTQGSGDGNYTITGGEGSTGTATFNTVSSGIQPVTGITGGSQVVVTRNIPIERVTDFSAGSDINRAALNTQLDTLTAIAADNKMRSVRALTAPITDSTDIGVNLIIPKAADRANGFLSFDSSGNVGINSVVNLEFLTLEYLDIDNIRIDANTISSTTGNLVITPTVDLKINIPTNSSLYMQRAGTTALDFSFSSVSQEIRFINTTTATTYSVIQSNQLGGTSSDLVLKSDGGPLVLDTGGSTIPLKDGGTQRGYLKLDEADKIKLYTGIASGTLNSTFDGANVTIEGALTVSGNLTVDGTTTTINSTTLTVDDKNIVLASGAADSTAANGAGITIDGANATLTYVHLTEAMTFNKDVDVGDNVIENAQKLHFTENVSLYPSDGDDSILNLQTEDSGGGQLRFITGTGAGAFRGGIVASQSNIFGLKDSNDQIFIKSQDGNLPTQILHTYDSPSAGNVVRIEAGSTYVKLYGSDGVEAQKYKDADDTSYYLEPAGTSILGTVEANQLDVDNITIDGNTISSTDTDGNINLRCNGSGVVDVDSELFVYGNAINGTAAYVQIGNTDTGGDDIRIQGPNPNFTLYDSTAVVDGVAAYTGGLLFYGQKTNTAYHTYSAIRPRIINGLDSDTAKTGALHFGVSDGASSALTNIIFKIEPDGIDVTGSITSSSDPLKISATTGSSDPNIILEGDASPSVAIRADGSSTNRLLLRYNNSNDFSYITASGNLSIEASNTGHTLSLTSNDGMFITNSSSNLTITSSSSDIVLKTGTSGSTSERFKVTGAGIVQSLSETEIVDETLKVTNGSTYGSLSMDENTGSSRDYFDIKAFGHDGSSTEGGAVRLFSASNLESIRTYSTGTTGAGYTTFNFPYDLSYGTGVYHLTVASANRSGLYLRSDVSGSDADGKQYGELSASSSELKMVGWFGANIEFKIGGDSGETKIAEINSDGLAFEDNKKAIFGAGSDLEVFHDGSASNIIDTGTGNLFICGSGAIHLMNPTQTEYYASFNDNGAVDLRYDNSIKLATTSFGAQVTGSLATDTITNATANTNVTIDTNFDIILDAGGDVGIGTSSPTSAIDVRGEAVFGNGTDGVKLTYSGGNSTGIIDTGFTSTGLEFRIANSEAMRITSSGNINISSDDKQIYWGAGTAAIDASSANDRIRFYTANSEVMRLSGTNLFVGKAEANLALTGIQATSSGQAFSVTRDGGAPFALNRKSSDGEIAGFYKDTVKVGSIRSYAGTRLGIGSNGGAGFIFGGSQVYPATDGTIVNDTHDLGSASYRFKDLYLAGDIAHKDAAGNARLLYDKSENLLGNAGTYLYGFGVYLGDTGAANLLDDYEEGTWTPTCESGSLTFISANYTKVGNLVTVTANVYNFSDTTSSTSIGINNLPFTSTLTNRSTGAVIGRYISSTKGYSAYIGANSTVVYFYEAPEATNAYETMKHSDLGGSDSDFVFTVTYRV